MATTLELPRSAVASPSIGPLRACILDNAQDIERLEPLWRELDHLVDSPIERLTWARACTEVFVPGGRWNVMTVFRGHQLSAIAPLAFERQGGIRRALMLGVGQLHEPMDLAYTDRKALDRLARGLVRLRQPLFLERVPADSPTVSALQQASAGRALVVIRPQPNCPYILLDETWLEPEQKLNSGRRSDLRRARRKAEKIGPVTTEIITPCDDELPALLDEAFGIEASSWKGEAGTALAHDRQRAEFFRRYAEEACRDGILRVCFLKIGPVRAAMQLAVECGGGLWLLKVGYDAQYSACSPGQLLMLDTIRYAAEAGLRRYEFLGKAETWTEMWTKDERRHVSLRIYPLGIRGLSAFGIDSIAALWRRWRRQ